MIGYYAHHHGSGHITRLQSITACLHESVWGLSSLQAPAGWTQPWTQLARDDTPSPSAAAAAGDVTAGGVLHWAPPLHEGLSARMAQLAEWIAQHRPQLLVVDVSVEVALLARLCGVPTVVVALPGRRLDRPHRLAHDSAEALLAPWPEGAHTDDWPSSWQDKVWCVGGISRFDGRSAAPVRMGARRPRRQVLVLWGSGGRSADRDAVAAARAAAPHWDWLERDPASSPSPDLWGELAAANVVVTHAGQNAVAEVAAARRPAVVIAQTRPFGEQEATAAAVNRLGAAVGLPSWPGAADWPALLERAASLGGTGWSRWSTGDGARKAACQLEALAGSVGAEGVA
ncbi:MAG: glycosyltransferase [Ornithinimicrobium sp.]|uniref:glycosyltransferase n=1 Tax=Ornithinimicrobium sp. TaxID=1977084 RepID=UPI003D9B7274